MNFLKKAIKNLRQSIKALEAFEDKEPALPKENALFVTFNGSIVYVMSTDADGDTKVMVLKGGHGITGMRGHAEEDFYYVDQQGYLKLDNPGAEIGMSLLEAIPVDLDLYFRKKDDELEEV